MSLWSDYIAELRDGEVTFVEHEWGFISYSLPPGGTAVFCEDIYIVPDKRDGAAALKLLSYAEEAGLKAGRTETIFIVKSKSPAASKNLRIYLAMGLEVFEAEGSNIWLKRKIKYKAV